MNDDPIAQLPEPYRAAWRIMHESMDLETLLINTLESLKEITSADSGMIVLKSDSSFRYDSDTSPVFRTLPNMKPTDVVDGDKISLLSYALACRAIKTRGSYLIPNIANVSSEEKQILTTEFLPNWMVKSSDEVYTGIELPVSLLITPIFTESVVAGVIVLSRTASNSPFVAQNLVDAEFFVTLIAKYFSLFIVLSNSTKVKDDILTFIIYETHPSLVSIRGYAEILLRATEYGTLNDKQVEFAKEIQKYHKILKRIITNSAYISRLEDNEMKSGNVKCNMGEIFENCYKQLKTDFEDKKQIVNLNSEKNILAQGDERKIEYVTEVFMKNACVYSPENSIINIFFEKQEDFVRVSVSDYGIGLTDEEKSHLFEKFYRSPRSEAREHLHGIGLDLFIAKKFIELMDGQIGAEGSPNQGSIFWFTLPITKE